MLCEIGFIFPPVRSLALRTIKDQNSALEVHFQRLLASHSLVRPLVQGVAHLVPLISYPLTLWDLYLWLLVLLEAMI